MGWLRALQWTLGLAVVLAPWLYATALAGDAEVHLCYARQAAQGCWFCFNPGEPSAGETSPGWLVLLTALFHVLPEAWVPVGLKVLSVLGWYAALAVGWLLVRRLGGPAWLPLGATAAVGLLPGSVQAGAMGMENAAFTAVLLGAIAVERGLALGALLAAAAWLRPEGLVLGAGLLASRAVGRDRRGLGLALGSFLLGIAGLLAFHHQATGLWWPASIAARRVQAMANAWTLGPILVDPRPTVRLLAYLPLLAWAGLAVRQACQPTGDRWVRSLGAQALLAWALPTLAGSEHTSRYLLPALALLGVLAAVGVRDRPRDQRLGRWLGLSAAWLAVVLVAETAVRLRMPEHGKVLRLMRAPAQRQAHTDRLLKRLGMAVEARPVVALREVQVRYLLDDRVTVRSLDGRTDAAWLAFVRRQRIDHLGWLQAARVDAVLEAPDLRPGPDGWTFTRLRELAPLGTHSPRPGLAFRRVGPSAWRVER